MELRGKELFEGMEDWEQAELIESKIEGLSQNYYEFELECQQKLLKDIKSKIYWEISVESLAANLDAIS